MTAAEAKETHSPVDARHDAGSFGASRREAKEWIAIEVGSRSVFIHVGECRRGTAMVSGCWWAAAAGGTS